MKLKTHPAYSEIIPPLSTEEFEVLQASIKADGVHTPIVVDESGTILDGHHRFECARQKTPYRVVKGLSDIEKEAYVIKANIERRNMSPAQKNDLRNRQMRLAKRMNQPPQRMSQPKIALALGVTHQTISNWLRTTANTCNTSKIDVRVKVPPKERPKIAQRVNRGEAQAKVAADYGVSQRQVSTIVRQETKQAEAVKARAETPIRSPSGLTIGDFRELGKQVKDASVDLIFTDPPYDAESVPLYADVAALGARVLRPGGWCLCYAGQTHLPKVLDVMVRHLSYGWAFCIIHKGGDLRFRKLKIQNKWKPLVGFYRPPLEAWWDWFPDAASGGREKGDHAWQQAEAEAAHFIKALTPDQGLVLDPMCGSGTTLSAAARNGRNWIGFDVDPEMSGVVGERLAR